MATIEKALPFAAKYPTAVELIASCCDTCTALSRDGSTAATFYSSGVLTKVNKMQRQTDYLIRFFKLWKQLRHQDWLEVLWNGVVLYSAIRILLKIHRRMRNSFSNQFLSAQSWHPTMRRIR